MCKEESIYFEDFDSIDEAALVKKSRDEGPPKEQLLAAEQGDPEAQYDIGSEYVRGYFYVANLEEGIRLLKLAAAQGHEGARRDLENVEKAQEYRISAEGGDAEAQYLIGRCHYHGIGTEYDPKKGVEWYRCAAEQGHVEAMYELGKYNKLEGIRDGFGVDRELLAEARKWYIAAARRGHARAAYQLGDIYYFGFGFSRFENHRKEAVMCYEFAAERGVPEAQYSLGICYEYGYGIEKDFEKAVKWYRLAAEQGNDKAIEALKKMGFPTDGYTVKWQHLQ